MRSLYIPNNLLNERSVSYYRKSTDDSDHQVASLDQQENSDKDLRNANNVPPPIKTYSEAMSAKAPGRPKYNEMINFIKEGNASVIYTWDISRLARNMEDGGKLHYLLQQKIIKAIITPTKIFLPEDNALLLNIELGVSNQYSRDLSRNVKRGLKRKLDLGWRPGIAPEGYLNDRTDEKGNRKIIIDPDRYNQIRKVWDLLLTGNYSVPTIMKFMNEEWHYKCKGHKIRGNKSISRSSLYKLFNNPFYYGEFKVSGEWYKGSHKPMITIEEFDRAQVILGRKGKHRPKTKEFAYTGLIKCGECGSTITAEEKINRYGKRYIYYHCTWRKKPKCKQKSIELNKLEEQIKKTISEIEIPEEFKDWAIKYLNEVHQQESREQIDINHNLNKEYDNCLIKIKNLIELKISPINSNNALLSDDEFEQKMKLLKDEKRKLEINISNLGKRVDKWLELSSKTFEFARYAREWFINGDMQSKRIILQTLGSNFTLLNKKLYFDLPNSYLSLKGIKKNVDEVLTKFESLEYRDRKTQLYQSFSENLFLRRRRDSNP